MLHARLRSVLAFTLATICLVPLANPAAEADKSESATELHGLRYGAIGWKCRQFELVVFRGARRATALGFGRLRLVRLGGRVRQWH